ncbi:VOC family protein [uncultured Clostridium sp.]|uniref:lactoylglutathione lyase n=1 Tax=uncultured Clostridium sp. TaxID=59620 RepID=UPI0025CCA807|nr:VOC family protein [uncultured Clostridium sp.]
MAVKMLHTCIRVKNLEESLKFYKEGFGLIETSRKDYPDYKFSLVYLSNEEGGYEIELTYNYDSEGYDLGNGFSHIAVGVDNLEESRENHIALGYEVTDLKGLPGEKPHYYFVTDPDGYKVEVIRN